MDFAVEVYRATRQFPREELYGLTSQVRRAAVSVPSNIAEGQGRGVGAEFAHHLRIGQNSLEEPETPILLGERPGYLQCADVNALMDIAGDVGRLTRGLHASVCPNDSSH